MKPTVADELVCTEFNAELDRLRAGGARLELIYPADNPHTAILSDNGRTFRLTSRPGEPAPSRDLPPFETEFVLALAGSGAGEGRAGMLYRDLIPTRLGGRYIASHITIPKGGPIADWVHFHRIAFQLIVVRKGWVRVVYEHQGEPFVMEAGDLVLQPPMIRHRVLESSPGLEVVEVTCPALHETFADHELALPTSSVEPDREFAGQRFVRHVAAQTPWMPFNGGEAQETGVRQATNGLAEARIIRSGSASALTFPAHDGELMFGFVLEGTARLDRGGASHALGPIDAFVIPPGEMWALSGLSDDFQLLQVATTGPPEFGLAAPGRSTL